MHVRSLFAVALAALLVGPATAHAQAKKAQAKAAAPAPTASTSPNYQIGGWIGWETDDPLDGFQLRGDFVWPFEKLAPGLDLSFVGSVGLSRLTFSQTVGGFGFTSTQDWTAWEFKLVPTARFTYTFAGDNRWSVFGDAGVGINYTSVSYEDNFGATADDSSTGFMLRLGAGGFFRFHPKWSVGATIVVDPSTGDFGYDTWSFLAGLKYQL